MAMVRPDQTVGLLGGSFDPPHAGHVHITLEALKRFELHQIWWLVSPGNPLKAQGPAPMAKRIAVARKLMDHPQVTISDFEARAGTRATADTLAALMAQHPGVRFVWLMGADNLAQMHEWQRWQWIMDTVPVGVLARPGSGAAARASPAAKRYDNYRLSGDRAAQLAGMQAPAWCFVDLPMVDLSSSAIRKRGDWAG